MTMLHHTGLTVSDLDQSLRFWRDAMGMQVIFQQEKKGGYIETIVGEPGAHVRMAHLAFDGEGTRIELFEYLSPRAGHHIQRPADVGFTHICVACDDIEERLAAAGRGGRGAVYRPGHGRHRRECRGPRPVPARPGRARGRALRAAGGVSPFDPLDIASTPFGAPLVPRLPIRLRRTEILTIVYRTSAEAAESLLPQPLRLASDLCLLHVYHMHDAEWFGVYCESAWQIPVFLPDGGEAVYSPFLVLGSDGAVAAGREAYGQPKKAGQVRLAPHGDLLVGVVERNGIDVATATMCWKQRAAHGSELSDLVPGADLNVNLRVRQEEEGVVSRELVTRRFADVVEHEAWTGPGTLELRPNAQLPVHLLAVREVVLGMHRIIDLTLAPGQVIHRYGAA